MLPSKLSSLLFFLLQQQSGSRGNDSSRLSKKLRRCSSVCWKQSCAAIVHRRCRWMKADTQKLLLLLGRKCTLTHIHQLYYYTVNCTLIDGLGERRRAPFSSSPTLASASVANKGHYVQHTIQSSFLFISEHFWCKGIDSLTCLRSVLSKKKLLAKWSFLSQSAANLFPLCLVSIRFLVPPALPPFYVKTCRLPPSQASSSCRYHQKITES